MKFFLLFFIFINFYLPLSLAAPGTEKPTKMRLPRSLLDGFFTEIKRQFPPGYDQHFQTVRINDHSRYYSVQNSSCVFDGWLTINIHHSRGEGSMTETMSFTCFGVRSTMTLRRYGTDLKETPAEEFISFSLFKKQLPKNFELEFPVTGIFVSYQENEIGEFTFYANRKIFQGQKSLEFIKRIDLEGKSIWSHRLEERTSQYTGQEDFVVEDEKLEEIHNVNTLKTVAEKNQDGLYFYNHFFNEKFIERPDYILKLQEVQKFFDFGG